MPIKTNRNELPLSDHVVRYCKPFTLDNKRPTQNSFQLRPGEPSLSVSWLEFYKDEKLNEKFKKMLQDLRLKWKVTGSMAILNNNEILINCAKKYNFIISIYQEKSNDSHSLIEPTDDLLLSKLLSENVMENHSIQNILSN